MFCDQPITHLDLLVILGQNLRLAIDVESAMNYKIMKVNGEYVCRTTVWSLIPTGLAWSEHTQLRNKFDAYVAKSLGPAATISDFDYKEYTDLTPDLYYYGNFDKYGAEGSTDDSPSRSATS